MACVCTAVVEDEMRMMVGDEYMVIDEGKRVAKEREAAS
jgi:hypothetical protein